MPCRNVKLIAIKHCWPIRFRQRSHAKKRCDRRLDQRRKFASSGAPRAAQKRAPTKRKGFHRTIPSNLFLCVAPALKAERELPKLSVLLDCTFVARKGSPRPARLRWAAAELRSGLVVFCPDQNRARTRLEAIRIAR